MNPNHYLCIHGHFYQPPRENPWTGEIEIQSTAAPFHDWNERIYQECYKPNSEAVIVDSSEKILRRVNNYKYISFNFGPALLDWIMEKHPETYLKIIFADKQSAALHNGHGNAIAMVYSHVIMPLASRRDKITQVRWGVRHFEYHFGRKPESIWLSETACNEETLEVLVGEGIKYIILDPSQAEKIRLLNSENQEWQDVSHGYFNTRFPYRCYVDEAMDRYIDIFFYDGAVSKMIAFDDILMSSEKLLDRIDSLKINNYEGMQLISLAVDGETFGHHKHFTDRTLAFLGAELAGARGYKTANFGEFLELAPPLLEVKIKPGVNGEGTSWSCIHGVGRWKEDCGCTTNSLAGWNQKWRSPLRNSLNELNDKLGLIFEEAGSRYLKNVWIARNDYIDLILDSSIESVNKFFGKNAVGVLSTEEKDKSLKLLEMQRFSLLMFTSCGWFFSDISGIETVKILEYAKRAIELAAEFTKENLETDFLGILKDAVSNAPGHKNGKDIYLDINTRTIYNELS